MIPRLLLAAALLLPATSHAREELLRWLDPNPAPSPVVGFRAHVGTQSRSYTTHIELGLPAPDEAGVYAANAEVGDAVTVFVALTAFDDTLESSYSNEQRRCADTGGDFNGDGLVSIADFSLLLYDWVVGDSGIGADMDCDGQISIADFSLLVPLFGRRVAR